MKTKDLTPAMKRVLAIAKIEASKEGMFVGVNHIMIAMMKEGNNFGALVLSAAGFTVPLLERGEVPKPS